MRFIIHDCEQRSDQWKALRLGKVCGSKAADMLAANKDGKWAAGRKNLLAQLVLERITGKSPEDSYQSRAMQQGTEREAEAAGYYESLTGRVLFEVGFLQHPTLAAGVSLDGYVGNLEQPRGIIEIKCPQPATHLEYLKDGRIPQNYRTQMLHALWITGAQQCDWMSYNPDFPEPLRAKIVPFHVKSEEIHAYEGLLKAFLAEVDAEESKVRMLMKGRYAEVS